MTCQGTTDLAPPTTPPSSRKPTYLKFTAYPGDVTAPGPKVPPAIAGEPIALEVSIMAQDSAVIAVSESVTVVLTGNRLASGTMTVLSVNGVARFADLVIDSAAFTNQFTASAADLPSRTGPWFTMMPAPLGAIRFVGQPTQVWAGTTRWPDYIQEPPWFTVEVFDQFGNFRYQGGDTVTLSITPGTGTPGAKVGGTFSGVMPNSITMPTLPFPLLTVDKVGSGYTMTARSGSVTSAPSAPFRVDPVLAFLVQPGPEAPGAVFNPAVQVGVVDGNSQPVANIGSTVTLTMSGGSGTLQGTLTQSASSGTATFGDLSVSKYMGVYRLRATATGTVMILDSVSHPFVMHGTALQVVGGTHPCAIANDGIAYCFFSQFEPRFEGVTPTRMAAGDGFECALAGTGQAWCRGDNMVGELGKGTGSIEVGDAWSVSGGLTFAQLTVGTKHVCGVTSGGTAYCWGSDSNGQLGDSVAQSQCYGMPCDTTPGSVRGGLVFTQLAAGQYHTCGLATDGHTYCWGANGYAQLGNLQLSDRNKPFPIIYDPGFTSLAAIGGDHSCGLTASGQAYCWGLDNYGQVGNGTVIDTVPSPTAVSGGLAFTQLVGGLLHTCGLTVGGQAYCWGFNESGELGDGTTTYRSTPVAVHGGLTFVQLVAGSYNTCGRTAGGQVWCWGSNSGRQLGDGTITDRSTPVRVVIF